MEENKQQQPLTPPDAPEQPEVVSTEAQSQPQDQSQTDVLGIISIVLAFVGMQIIGLIVAIIGMKKAKEEGYPNTLSKVGLILNIVFIALVALVLVPFIIFLMIAAASA